MMKSATSLGWDSIGTWLEGSVKVFASILFAVTRSWSGEIIRSFDAITNQLGFLPRNVMVCRLKERALGIPYPFVRE